MVTVLEDTLGIVGVRDSDKEPVDDELVEWPVRDDRAYTTVVCEYECPCDGENSPEFSSPKVRGMFDYTKTALKSKEAWCRLNRKGAQLRWLSRSIKLNTRGRCSKCV